VIAGLLLGAASGCLGPQKSDYTSSQVISVADRSEEADRLWTAIQDALRENPFRLDRVDRRAGVVTTQPELSQNLFEVWRHDVDTWPDLLEATLNSIRRRVEVTITRDDNAVWSHVEVVVHKERLSSPDNQFNSTGEVYRYFGNTLPSTTGMGHVTTVQDTWVDIGRDPAMEEYLLLAILRRAGIEAAFADTGEGT
jgi:hypothetical protein